LKDRKGHEAADVHPRNQRLLCDRHRSCKDRLVKDGYWPDPANATEQFDPFGT